MKSIYFCEIYLLLLFSACKIDKSPIGIVDEFYWMATNGPHGASVNSIIIDSANNIYISANKGVYILNQQENKWQKINTGLPASFGYHLLKISNNELFVAVNFFGIYKTDKSNINWEKANFPQNISVITGNGFGKLWAYNGNFLHSADNGLTWNELPGTINAGIITLRNDNLGVIYAGTDNGIYISQNDGNSFIQSGLSQFKINDIKINSQDIIFCASDNGIYRLLNSGDNWSAVTATDIEAEFIFIDNDDNVYYSDAGHIFRSSDNGGTWHKIYDSFVNSKVFDISTTRMGVIFAANEAGIIQSDNNGAGWQKSVRGIQETWIIDLKQNVNGDLLAGTRYNGLFISIDFGKNWVPIMNTVQTAFAGPIAIDNSGVIYTATAEGILKSSDLGLNWQPTGISRKDISSVVITESGTIFAATTQLIYKSSDKGATWIISDNGISSMDLNNFGANIQNELFIGDEAGNIFKSSDDGNQWILFVSLGNAIKSLWVENDIVYAGTEISGLYKLNSNGKIIGNLGLKGKIIYDILINAGREIFASTDSGVYFSDETTGTWRILNSGFSNTIALSLLQTSDKIIFAGSFDSGVIKLSR